MSETLRQREKRTATAAKRLRLETAISRLAGHIDCGALMAATDPAALLRAAADRIAELEARTPAWTPGPPMQPGWYELTCEDTTTGERYVVLPFATSGEPNDRERVVAHRPYHPEPFKG